MRYPPPPRPINSWQPPGTVWAGYPVPGLSLQRLLQHGHPDIHPAPAAGQAAFLRTGRRGQRPGRSLGKAGHVLYFFRRVTASCSFTVTSLVTPVFYICIFHASSPVQNWKIQLARSDGTISSYTIRMVETFSSIRKKVNFSSGMDVSLSELANKIVYLLGELWNVINSVSDIRHLTFSSIKTSLAYACESAELSEYIRTPPFEIGYSFRAYSIPVSSSYQNKELLGVFLPFCLVAPHGFANLIIVLCCRPLLLYTHCRLRVGPWDVWGRVEWFLREKNQMLVMLSPTVMGPQF